MTEAVASFIRPGDHATTFGGGPFVATVALSVVQRIAQPAFLAHVEALGTWLGRTLAQWVDGATVLGVRGIGLMWGIELSQPAAPVIARALDEGLLILSAGERVIRLLPPLVTSLDQLQAGMTTLRRVLS
jgi:acetylornithine/succinyldiaminopimelate/putrescine aminotransferase